MQRLLHCKEEGSRGPCSGISVGCDELHLPCTCHLCGPLCHCHDLSPLFPQAVPSRSHPLLHLVTWFTCVYMCVACSFQGSVTFWSSACPSGSCAPHMSAACPHMDFMCQPFVPWVIFPSQANRCLTCSCQGNSFNIPLKITIQPITTQQQ